MAINGPGCAQSDDHRRAGDSAGGGGHRCVGLASVWFAIFFAMLTTVIRVWEEPHLARRFGGEYVNYRRNVPRWIPRLSPWEPSQ